MKKNFLMLNFCTEYSSEGNTQKALRKDACFSTIFYSEGNGIVQKNKYTIILYKIGDWLNKKRQNNACLMDRAGIVHHLKILQSVFKFSYHLKEKEDHFVLTITLEGDLIYHKYMLSWVRYLYEYPFNVFLEDAYKLKEIPGFKFESIINLFNLVGATSGICQHGTRIHAIGETHWFKALMTTKEIQAKLRDLKGGNTRVNDIFPVVFTNKRSFGDPPNKVENMKTLGEDDNNLHSSDYWDSEEEFNKRLEFYKENYKILKDYKKKK